MCLFCPPLLLAYTRPCACVCVVYGDLICCRCYCCCFFWRADHHRTSAASHRAVINQRTRLIYFYSLTHSNANLPTHKFADWPTKLIITRSDVSERERERVLRCGVILLIIFRSVFFCCCLQCSRNSFEIRFCTQHTPHGLKMKWGLKARDLLFFCTRRMFAIKVLFVLWHTRASDVV